MLLDCPAGIEQGFKNAVAGADRALVVTTPEVSAIRDADRIIGLLEASCIDRIDLVVNRMRYDMVKRGDMMSVDDVVDILSVPLIGVVPDDENVVVATNQGEPLVGNHTLAGRAYRNICQRILGEEIPYLNLDVSISFWTKVSGIFHKNHDGNYSFVPGRRFLGFEYAGGGSRRRYGGRRLLCGSVQQFGQQRGGSVLG